MATIASADSMSDAFNPYYKWLGIPLKEQPPHHYRLLGIALFESDPDVIETAADRQMSHVQKYKTGQHSRVSQQLLNELATAKVCLLVAEKKAVYDQQLSAHLAPPSRPASEPTAAQVRRAVPVEVPPIEAVSRIVTGAAAAEQTRLRKAGPSRIRLSSAIAGGLALTGVSVAVVLLVGTLTRQPREPIAEAPTRSAKAPDVLPGSPTWRLAPLERQVVKELEQLSVRLRLKGDAPVEGNIEFVLVDSAPSGMTLDRRTGQLTWQPAEEQGPGDYRVAVRLVDAASGETCDELLVPVLVAEVNQLPLLEVVADSDSPSGAISLQLRGRDPDVPAKKLIYAMDSGAPRGAIIDPQSGRFTWQPPAEEAGKQFDLIFHVTEDGAAGLTARKTYRVAVRPPSAPARPATAASLPTAAATPPAAAPPSAPPQRTRPKQNLIQIEAPDVPPGDPRQDRLLAEAILKARVGRVEVISAGQLVRNISTLERLPDGELQLMDVRTSLVGLDGDHFTACLKGLKHLKSLHLSNMGSFTDAGCESIGHLPSLTQLAFSPARDVTDAGMSHVGRLIHLELLVIHEASIGAAGLAAIAPLTALKQLEVWSNALSDEGLRHLAALPQLETLTVRCKPLNGSGLASFAQAASLRNLTLYFDTLPDANVRHLEKLTNLSKLFLEAQFSDTVFGPIGKLPGLEHLTLHSTAITGNGPASLADCKTLSYLRLVSPMLGDNAFVDVGQLKALHELTIGSASGLTGSGLVHLADLPGLQNLLITDATALTDSNLVHLEQCVSLTRLYLNLKTQFSDAALVHLGKIPRLDHLSISGPRITDAGLSHLKPCVTLRSISLEGTQVSDQGVAALKQMLPSCSINKSG